MWKNAGLLYMLLTISSLGFNGCDKINKCQNIDCFTPPGQFIFDIVDSGTKENVFAAGLFNPDEVSVKNEAGKWTLHKFLDYGDTMYFSSA